MNVKHIVIAAVAALVAAAPASAAGTVPYLPVPHDASVILNTGSTNAAGYRIVLQASGDAEYVWGGTRATASIDPALASTYFADAARAMPFSQLRVLPCMKSASFGSYTFVYWRHERSHDMSCPGDAAATKLYQDTAAIARALNVGGMRPLRLPTDEPRMPLPTATPRRPAMGRR